MHLRDRLFIGIFIAIFYKILPYQIFAIAVVRRRHHASHSGDPENCFFFQKT